MIRSCIAHFGGTRDRFYKFERLRVAWDDPCHLCHAQGVRAEPRRILDRLRGVDVVALPDSEACCGSAGIYSLLRPDDARAVFDRKLTALRESRQQQQRLVSDASHELRTPLTSLRTNVELLQWVDDMEPDERREVVDAAS